MEIIIKHRIFSSEGEKNLSIQERVDKGSFVHVVGNSGVGKTTFLKILAGLLFPDYGYIKLDDAVLVDTQENVFVVTQQRKIAFMFQNYALFPNMTVRQNVLFAQTPKDNSEVDRLLEKFELKKLEHVYPAKLSGGQKQRVALARALVQKAEVVLLDEPISSVDAGMRKVMLEEINSYHKRSGATYFVVSHQADEMLHLADCVIRVM